MRRPPSLTSDQRAKEDIHVKVVIADDHGIVRDGVRMRLELFPEIEVVGEARNGAEAIEVAKKTSADVVLMDVRMPEVDGIEATKAIRKALPETAVVILSTYDDRDLVRAAVDAGAAGYLLKTASAQEIVDALQNAREGKVALHPDAAKALVEAMSEVPPAERFGLSPREVDVLRNLSQGKSNKEIAAALHISPLTVKTHMQSIFAKLGANDRSQAVAIALRSGIVD
jgi:DNA-binding NarL/FixJ family response regulator